MDKNSQAILDCIYDTRIGYLYSADDVCKKIGLSYFEFENLAHSLHRQGLVDLYKVTGPQVIQSIGLTKHGFNLVSRRRL